MLCTCARKVGNPILTRYLLFLFLFIIIIKLPYLSCRAIYVFLLRHNRCSTRFKFSLAFDFRFLFLGVSVSFLVDQLIIIMAWEKKKQFHSCNCNGLTIKNGPVTQSNFSRTDAIAGIRSPFPLPFTWRMATGMSSQVWARGCSKHHVQVLCLDYS